MALVCSLNGEVIERTTSNSSAISRTWGKRSLTGVPQVPPGAKFQGVPRQLPLESNWVGDLAMGNGWPCRSVRTGLGSNVSICPGPPSM